MIALAKHCRIVFGVQSTLNKATVELFFSRFNVFSSKQVVFAYENLQVMRKMHMYSLWLYYFMLVCKS